MFSGLRTFAKNASYGAVIDIGSASVGIAIIESTLEETPTILWNYRESITIYKESAQGQAQKRLQTALLNVFLELGSAGLPALAAHKPGATLQNMQVSISAPWAYTVSKLITLEKEEPFTITKKMVDELVTTAQNKAIEHMNEDALLEDLDLVILGSDIIDVTVNGYSVHNPYEKEVKKIDLTQITGIAEKDIMNSFDESCDKILSAIEKRKHTFMYTFYLALKDLHPDISEVCLIDITSATTEIGIVREGILRSVTHLPIGSYSIIQSIAKECNIPLNEASGYLKRSVHESDNPFSVEKKERIEKIFTSYRNELVTLFKKTGDSLYLPHTLFLHTDTDTEKFFKEHILQALAKKTENPHTVHCVTTKILAELKMNDTALALSAYVFHKKLLAQKYLSS